MSQGIEEQIKGPLNAGELTKNGFYVFHISSSDHVK